VAKYRFELFAAALMIFWLATIGAARRAAVATLTQSGTSEAKP